MKKYLLLAALSLIPLLIGIGLALYLQFQPAPVPVLVFRADLRSVILILTALVSAGILALTFQSQWTGDRCERTITELHHEQEEVRRRFLRRLDHEAKNPLTAMRAALANLTDTAGSPEQEKLVKDVQHQVERLSQLVGDLRKLAELEERPLEALPVDLNELLAEVVEMARSQPAYQDRSVQVVISKVPWPLPRVTGDRDLLWLVFYNLIDNALKYTGPENTVEVRALEDGQDVIVEVADNGPGIPPEDRDRVFEELYRGKNARGTEGSGLGLALTQRIIQRHDGSISLRSRTAQEGPGGTVFVVRFPSAR